DIMPLFAPSIPPGFDPPAGLIAPEVFEQMQLYMNCIDPEERRIREFRMKKALDDLSKDSISQRAGLRMEGVPVLSNRLNKDKGLVFDFNRTNADAAPETGESSSHSELQRRHSNNRNLLAIEMEQGQRSVSETRFNRSHVSGMINDRNRNVHHVLGTEQDEGDTFGLTPTPTFGGFEIGSGYPAQARNIGASRGTSRKGTSWTRRGKRNAQDSQKATPQDVAESESR
ncbi:hypothetical protein HID58_013614, partial [Brassica napus]